MLNNACLKCWFWSKTDKMGLILVKIFITIKSALFRFTSFLEPMPISLVVSLFSEKLAAN